MCFTTAEYVVRTSVQNEIKKEKRKFLVRKEPKRAFRLMKNRQTI